MGIIINLPERLGPKIDKILQVESYESREDLFEKLIDEKIQELKHKRKTKKKVFETAKKVRRSMVEGGLTEEEILEDFERFTKTLKREDFLKYPFGQMIEISRRYKKLNY
ncbi:MAG: hypothetical protein ACE5IW_03775 [bacterium]